MIKKFIKHIAKKLGLVLTSNYDFEQKELYISLLEQLALASNSSLKEGCTIIVFSKDRALQLDALIRSFYDCVENPPKMLVLYHCSSSEFEQAYEKLKRKNQSKLNLTFVKENAFKTDLVELMRKVTTEKLLFLVDDIFFKSKFDFNVFLKLDTKTYVPSLRMAPHLNFAYTLQQKQALPKLTELSKEEGFLSWDFKQAEFDWAYPLSVDGHLFETKDFKIVVEALDFKAPNSFEEALQVMLPLYQKKRGVCFHESKIINIPCNKVQAENTNISGEISIQELNEKWLNGFIINYKEHLNIRNKSAHQELTFSFEKDEN